MPSQVYFLESQTQNYLKGHRNWTIAAKQLQFLQGYWKLRTWIETSDSCRSQEYLHTQIEENGKEKYGIIQLIELSWFLLHGLNNAFVIIYL